MPAYNPPPQTLFSPVSNYYQGKAIRQQLAAGEQEAELRQAELDSIPAQRAAAQRKGEIAEAEEARKVAQELREVDGNVREKLYAGAKSAMDWYDENPDDKVGATEAFSLGYGDGAQDVMPGGDNYISPQEARSLVAAKDYADDGVDGAQTQFIGDDGQAHVGTYNKETFEYTDTSGRVHKNAKPVSQLATQDELSLGGGADTNQMGIKIREVMGSTDNLITSMDRIGDLVDEAPQASLGLPGAVSEFVDQAINAVDGFAEIAGGWAEVNGKEVDSSALLDVRLYSDYFAGVSGTNAAIEANAVGVSYALARAANPDGRISDADVRHQLERLQLNQSSKTRIRESISEVRRETLSSAINWLRRSGATKSPEGREAFKTYSDALEAMDGGDAGDVYSRAKAAIVNGADPEAVKKRLIDLGHDPSRL